MHEQYHSPVWPLHTVPQRLQQKRYAFYSFFLGKHICLTKGLNMRNKDLSFFKLGY